MRKRSTVRKAEKPAPLPVSELEALLPYFGVAPSAHDRWQRLAEGLAVYFGLMVRPTKGKAGRPPLLSPLRADLRKRSLARRFERFRKRYKSDRGAAAAFLRHLAKQKNPRYTSRDPLLKAVREGRKIEYAFVRVLKNGVFKRKLASHSERLQRMFWRRSALAALKEANK